MDKPSIPPSFAARAAVPPGLDARSAAVLREIVEQYVETGEPVGSRTLSRRLPISLSPATIRNVMADLTDAGLLFAPHTSGVPEDPATGSASGPLGAYLYRTAWSPKPPKCTSLANKAPKWAANPSFTSDCGPATTMH